MISGYIHSAFDLSRRPEYGLCHSLSIIHQHTQVISVLLEGAQFAIVQNSLYALNQNWYKLSKVIAMALRSLLVAFSQNPN